MQVKMKITTKMTIDNGNDDAEDCNDVSDDVHK